MLSKTLTSAITGLDGQIVEVEVDIAKGMPAFTLVGLPDTAVQESKERVRSAIRNSGAKFPGQRITVSLAPSDLRKSGPAYDLPIAVGILISSEQIPAEGIGGALLLGEIGLDGSLRHTQGILPMVGVGRKSGFTNIFVPEADATEAALVHDVSIYPVRNLSQIISHIKGELLITPQQAAGVILNKSRCSIHTDIKDVRGQEHAKRALEIAAAGGHNLLMSGPPGSGKTLLARCIPGVLPPMTPSEALETTTIYSVAGLLPTGSPLVQERPFRAPHYTISNAGLVGGGAIPRPGEITLSHRGVLFLDELPEFGYASLDALRQPLEDRTVTISRARGTVSYPANFMLIGAMNPCPCGFYNDPKHDCSCSHSTVMRYQRRISGPLIDRMDMFVSVPRVEYDKLSAPPDETANSAAVADRVAKARAIQTDRFTGTSLTSNSDMGPAEILSYCQTEDDAKALLQRALDKLGLSARGFHRILKLGRTISDLKEDKTISLESMAEALQYRPHSVA